MNSRQTRPLMNATLAMLFFVTIFSLALRHGPLAGAALPIHIVSGSLTVFGSLGHLFARREWIMATVIKPRPNLPSRVRLNRAIDLALISALIPLVLSSLALVFQPDAAAMEHLHQVSGLAFTALTAVHMGMHRKSMRASSRQMFRP
jgi:hypothetical protein